MGKHSEWRKVVKRLRRKRIRQTLAKLKYDKELGEQKHREQSPNYQNWLKEQEESEKFQAEEEARLAAENEAKWLEREKQAQAQWQELQKKLAVAREEKAKQNALIKLEWDKEQKRLKEIKEQKEQEAAEKLRQHLLLREEIDNFINHGGDTPEHLKVEIEINPSKPICPFFQKTSACKFRDLCSRNHIKSGVSRIILISNFYSHYSLEKMENEYGSDATLEFESDETYSHFKEFFYDVVPEMEKCGQIIEFKVCCNSETHLRGNVYVEYSKTREALKSFQIFNGRWYAGKQLSVEFCKIESWKAAICGLHFKKKCPKGRSCNFLHVYRNPNNLYNNYERDIHKPSKEFNSSNSERRNWRWSESPERLYNYWEDNGHRNDGDDEIYYKNKRHSESKSRTLRTRSRNGSKSHKRKSSQSSSRREKRRKHSTSSRRSNSSKNLSR